jgi:hypothetical protein
MRGLTFATPNASKPYEAGMQAIWDRAPAFTRKRPVTVRMVTREQINAVFGRDTSYTGYYDGTINLLWRQGEARTLDVFRHELGHHVEGILGITAEWAAFFDAHRAWMPSNYGRTNSTEGWAESWDQWLEGAALHPGVKAEIDRYVARATGGGGPVTPQSRTCPTCKGTGRVPT